MFLLSATYVDGDRREFRTHGESVIKVLETLIENLRNTPGASKIRLENIHIREM